MIQNNNSQNLLRNLLVVDIGNSNICFGVLADWKDQLPQSFDVYRLDTFSGTSSVTQYADFLSTCLAKHGLALADITDISVASVVPNATNIFLRFVDQNLPHVRLEQLTPPYQNLSIELCIDNPMKLGADRVANAISAAHHYSEDIIVIIDFGTATKIDCLVREDSSVKFVGGAICPGMLISANALGQRAALLDNITITSKPGSIIGTNTIAAMQSGIYYGHVSLVKGMIQLVLSEIDNVQNKNVKIIATGGLAPLLCDNKYLVSLEVDTELTLKGLLLYAS